MSIDMRSCRLTTVVGKQITYGGSVAVEFVALFYTMRSRI